MRIYIQHVSEGRGHENEFLRHELLKSHKKNTFIGKALAELDWTEKKMLLDDSIEKVYQQSGQDGGATGEVKDTIEFKDNADEIVKMELTAALEQKNVVIEYDFKDYIHVCKQHGFSNVTISGAMQCVSHEMGLARRHLTDELKHYYNLQMYLVIQLLIFQICSSAFVRIHKYVIVS